jgi:hypothetical protein
LIACSCDAIDAIGYNSSRWRWQREGGSCLPPPLNPKSCAVGEAAAAAAGEGRGGGERETMEWKGVFDMGRKQPARPARCKSPCLISLLRPPRCFLLSLGSGQTLLGFVPTRSGSHGARAGESGRLWWARAGRWKLPRAPCAPSLCYKILHSLSLKSSSPPHTPLSLSYRRR